MDLDVGVVSDDPPEVDSRKSERRQAAGDVCRELVQFFRLIGQLRTVTQDQVKSFGVDHSCFPLLANLIDRGPLRASMLAKAVRSDQSTVSRQVAALVERGLIERIPDPADGRASLLQVSVHGELLYQQMKENRNEVADNIMRRWQPGEIQQLADLLGRFNQDLTNDFPAVVATATHKEH